MTTMNQQERARFLQTLEDDAQFRHGVRSLLLSQELLELPERFAQFTSYVTTFIERQQAFNQRIEDTLGVLKGNAARRLLNDSFETILESFQLDFVGFLVRDDLVRMARQSGLSNEVELGQRQSFYRADMVLQGIDDHGNTHYVAAEASFTADLRDTNRAIRNAGFLTRMTGHVAHPLVASVVNDRDVQELVGAGTIHWLQFDPRELEAD